MKNFRKKFQFLKFTKMARVSEYYHKQLKMAAVEQETTVSSMLNSALKLFFGPSPEMEEERNKYEADIKNNKINDEKR